MQNNKSQTNESQADKEETNKAGTNKAETNKTQTNKTQTYNVQTYNVQINSSLPARIYLVSRAALAAIFFYHGLVPKVWFRHVQEIEMNSTFMPMIEEQAALVGSGVAEIVFAVALLVLYRVKWFNYVIIAFGTFATLAITVQLPHLMTAAFNPFSTNLSIIVFAVINLMAGKEIASSGPA